MLSVLSFLSEQVENDISNQSLWDVFKGNCVINIAVVGSRSTSAYAASAAKISCAPKICVLCENSDVWFFKLMWVKSEKHKFGITALASLGQRLVQLVFTCCNFSNKLKKYICLYIFFGAAIKWLFSLFFFFFCLQCVLQIILSSFYLLGMFFLQFLTGEEGRIIKNFLLRWKEIDLSGRRGRRQEEKNGVISAISVMYIWMGFHFVIIVFLNFISCFPVMSYWLITAIGSEDYKENSLLYYIFTYFLSIFKC